MLRREFMIAGLSCATMTATVGAAGQRGLLLATASAGGTYYPVGVALATFTNLKLQQPHGIEITAVVTAGSAENVHLLERGDADLAILQGLAGRQALDGSGPFADIGPNRVLRSITALWPNVEHFVIRAADRQSGTISDLIELRGQRVAFGRANSGTLTSNLTLLRNLGIDAGASFELADLGYGPAADALMAGGVAAVGLPAGLPNRSLARLKSAMGEEAVILGFTPEQAAKADGGLGLWSPYTIPAGTYPSQPDDVPTIAQPNFLAARAGIAERDVYLLVRAVFEDLPFLRSMHPAMGVVSLETAVRALPLPLHPGAVRYYEETGLEIPPGLRPG